jgi:HlyD family secretion protein
MKPSRRILAALSLLVATAVAGCSGSKKVEYLTAPVARGDLTVTVSATGTLNPVTLVNVGTQVSGTVNKLNVDYNSRVHQGEVLAQLDERTYLAAVHQSEANVANATASRALADANARRAEGLFAKGYIAQQDLDTAHQLAISAAAQRDLALAQLDRDRTNLGYTVIRSPVSGVVVSREIDVGQTVAASFQTPTLFKIAQDLAKMQIDSSFAEADVGRIRVDQPVRFTVDAFPDRVFSGAVRQVRLNPTTVQNVVTYDVVVGVDNPDQILLPGMTAYVNVVLSEKKNVLTVPNAALRFRPPGVDAPSGTPPAAGAGGAGGAGAAAGAGRPAGNAGGTGAVANGGRPAGAGGEGASGRSSGTGSSQGHGGGHRGGAMRAVYVLRNGAPVAVQVRLGGTDRRATEVLEGELKDGDLVIIGIAGGAGGTAPGAPRVRMF